MQHTAPHCGCCNATMERRAVAPCVACGGRPRETLDFERGRHSFVRVAFLHDAVLCDFCLADLSGTSPTLYGLPEEAPLEALVLGSRVETVPGPIARAEDWVCPRCDTRFALQLVVRAKVRARREDTNPPGWPYLMGRHTTGP